MIPDSHNFKNSMLIKEYKFMVLFKKIESK
jgi:hypothetical protein